MGNKYYGKYRGIVTAVETKGKMFRLKAEVPSVMEGYETDWALPCLNFAFGEASIGWTIKKGDLVWIEFEEGDLDMPIWTGGWFSENNAPDFIGIKINGTLLEFKKDGVKVHGKITATDDIKADSVSLKSHTHGGVETGFGHTTKPL